MTPTSDAAATLALALTSGPSTAPPRLTTPPPVAGPAVTATKKTKATPTQIVKQAIATQSQQFRFTSLPLNKALPRSKISKEHAAIHLAHGLIKLHVLRQLKHFKDKKYRLKDVVLSWTPEQISEVLEEGIGMEYSKFACLLLTNLCKNKCNLGNCDLNNYASIIVKFPAVAIDLLNAFCTDGSLYLAMLVGYVKSLKSIALDEFPKSVARLPDADLGFQV